MIDPRRRLVSVALVSLVAVGVASFSSSASAAPVFIGLDDVSGRFDAVSGDGRVAVGSGFHPGEGEEGGFRWTRGGVFDWIGVLAKPLATSHDGSIVVGSNETPTFVEAFRWTSAGGLVGLGDLPGGAFGSEALGVSADGGVIVGEGRPGGGWEAVRWTEAGGPEGLGDLATGIFGSRAVAVSADGETVVGTGAVEYCTVHGCTSEAFEAFRWTQAEGMTGLADVTLHGTGSRASAVSADGSVVVGTLGTTAFRWTAAGGLEKILEAWDDEEVMTFAHGVSADGTIVVGSVMDYVTMDFLGAFIWDPVNGGRYLAEVLADEHGVDLEGWTLLEATGISADGRTIVGWGTGPLDYQQPWMVTVPEPAAGPLMAAIALPAFGWACWRRRTGPPVR